MIPYQGAGAISASGNGRDVIQDGGRKRKLHLHLDGVSKGLSILLMFMEIKNYIVRLSKPGAFKNTGGRLNKKDGLTRYGNSHVKDKTS